MIRREVIRKRLNKLEEYLQILDDLQRYSFDEFQANPERYGSAERFLQLAIEAINDVGAHIVAGLELGPVDWYSDIPERLYEAKYIDRDLREVWVRMIGFRNVLVHDYLTIDRGVVYDVLKHHYGRLSFASRCFRRFSLTDAYTKFLVPHPAQLVRDQRAEKATLARGDEVDALSSASSGRRL
ncbi:MAG: DUF86 domain-containing protein [Chloroflexi bacterium]|nr:DUF86 domain-containing protein [Chloroflexota bacterium]